MSTSITLHCDRGSRYSTCARQITLSVTAEHTVPQARAAAERQGWRSTRAGQDLCPDHSGARP